MGVSSYLHSPETVACLIQAREPGRTFATSLKSAQNVTASALTSVVDLFILSFPTAPFQDSFSSPPLLLEKELACLFQV